MAAGRPRDDGRGSPECAATAGGRPAAPEPEAGAGITVTTVPGRGGAPDLRVVQLVGDIDRRSVTHLEAALAKLEGDPAPGLDVIDLTGVRYLDDRAVRALFAVADRFAVAGRTLHVVAGAGSESERVARIMQLETFVAVHDTLDDLAGPM